MAREAEKSHDLLSESWRTLKGGIVIPVLVQKP